MITGPILRAKTDCSRSRPATKKSKLTGGQTEPLPFCEGFPGELVPQDPNDEPAEVLLEKIRAD